MTARRRTDEGGRLETLRRYRILDTPPEKAFDTIVQLAARTCHTPVALVTLVDEARQWFKARVGFDMPETSREIAFCARTIEGAELCTVPDALADARFRDNPLVQEEPHIRFYAGIPLITSDGFALGTLCVIDRAPRDGLSGHEKECLELLARETMSQLELRRALNELSDTKRVLEDANVQLEAFGAAVAHDLRAPVRHIDAHAALLGEEKCGRDPAAEIHLSQIRRACSTMRGIIDALLRLSRVSHSGLSRERVDVTEIALDLAAELRAAEPTRTGEIDIADGLTAYADPAMVRVALANLMSNAWKFSRGRSPPRIEVGGAPWRGVTEFYVKDNGVGFDPARMLLPVRPFARHHSALEYEGVGLGLTIVERIVRRHGGTLRVEAQPDRGAAFYFTLTSELDIR